MVNMTNNNTSWLQDSWADQQGIIPGSELIELEGQEAGRLSADEFRQALKQRPLRLKLAPPHGEVWLLGREK